jgi:hypothetical protein
MASAAELQWLREWADPVAHAHAQWWAHVPAPLLAAAQADPAARRALRGELRARVPLPALADTNVAARAPWALGTLRQINYVFDHVGWLLLRPWALRAVTRRDIEGLVAGVGKNLYDRALAEPLDLWTGDTPLLHEPYTLSPAQVQQRLRSLGQRAVMQLLSAPLASLGARVRLVAGPTLAPVDDPLPIDQAALLRELNDEEALG